MRKSFLGWAFALLPFLGAPGMAEETTIAIEPHRARVDLITKKVRVYGQKIVHRVFDVELEDGIMNVPLFTIQYAGLHHREQSADDPNHVEARAKCIAERLEIAWHLLKEGGDLIVAADHLVVADDDWETQRLRGRRRPAYSPAPQALPAIFVAHENLGPQPLRIVTVYEQDVIAFPKLKDPRVSSEDSVPWTPWELAHYIRALILAHHHLFEEKSTAIMEYESLQLDTTREGRIFKELFIRAQEVMVLKQQAELESVTLRDALARVSMPQRQRLVNLSFIGVTDWGEKEERP